jgi:hypothetical protein
MRLKQVILFLFASAFLSGCVHDKTAAKLFGNMSYLVGNEFSGDKVTLVNGEYFKRNLWHVRYDDRYVYGDFNQDGLKDAAVIIVVNSGAGNSESYQLAFLINDGKKLAHQASRELDVWAIINSVKEENGKVVVDMYVHQKGDCNAGPSKRERNVYEYNGPDDFAANRKS